MSGDRTIIKPSEPKFAMKQVVYIRASALRGFLEPISVARVEFNPGGFFLYRFFRQFTRNPLYTGGVKVSNDLLPFPLREDQILTLCEALDIQVPVLRKELEDMQRKFTDYCGTEVEKSSVVPVVEVRGLTEVPSPRFGINEVVYLKESAEVLGRLEAFRVSDMNWDVGVNEWVYNFNIRPRPEKNMVVGDRNEVLRGHRLGKVESELCTICESIPLALDFLERAISRAESRRASFCSEGSG